jgi:hypothetical protein
MYSKYPFLKKFSSRDPVPLAYFFRFSSASAVSATAGDTASVRRQSSALLYAVLRILQQLKGLQYLTRFENIFKYFFSFFKVWWPSHATLFLNVTL